MAMVGVRELKNRLTQYLGRARQGEEIVVTHRGRPIALIRPIGPMEPVTSRDAQLARLAAQGLLTLPTRKLSTRVTAIKVKGEPLSRTVIADRR